jgi:hypothetical protein
VALPDSREAFRRLVEAQDLTTASGRQTFTVLLGVSDAFDEIQRVAEGAGGSLENLAGKLQEAIDGALPKFLSAPQIEARSLEQIASSLQAAGVQTTVATLREITKAQIFEFAQAFVLAGNTSEAAKIAVVEAAASLADLKDAATSLSQEVAGRLKGAIDNALPKFLSPAQQQERQLQKIVGSLQAVGVQATVDALRNASKDQIFDFAQAFVLAGTNSDEAKLAVVEAAASLADLKDAASALTDSLAADVRQFNASLNFSDLSPLSPLAQVDAARELFRDTLARAAAGDQDARANVIANGRAFIEEGRSAFGSTTTAADIFREVQDSLNRLVGGVANLEPPVTAPEAGNLAQQTSAALSATIGMQEALSQLAQSGVAANDAASQERSEQLARLQAVVENQRAQIEQQAAIAAALVAELQRISGGIGRILGDAQDAAFQGVAG